MPTDNAPAPQRPTGPGQWVRSFGQVGITTDRPMARSPRIAVMFAGGRWVINAQLNELEVIPSPFDKED